MGGSEVREGGLREVEDGAPMVCARKRRELRWAAAASRARDRETLPDRVTAGTETPCCPADTPRMRPGAWSPNKKKTFPLGGLGPWLSRSGILPGSSWDPRMPKWPSSVLQSQTPPVPVPGMAPVVQPLCGTRPTAAHLKPPACFGSERETERRFPNCIQRPDG